MPRFVATARRQPLSLSDPEPAEGKDQPLRQLIALAALGPPAWTDGASGALARAAYAQNPIAYRCVRMIAEAAASAPLVVFQGSVRAPDHPLQALLDRPNPDQSAPDLMEGFFGALQTFGDAYLLAAGGEGPPDELYVLRSDRVKAILNSDGWPGAYSYAPDGKPRVYPRRSDGFMPVLHLRLLNPLDDRQGLSPAQAARFAIDIHNASSAWNKALLDNAARPSGALVYANPATGDRMTGEQFDRLKAELLDAHTGAASAGRPLLLEGGLDWKPMALTPSEMDFIEGKHVAAREIALAYGVPPMLLGIPGDATYSNFREANAAFWRHTIVPLADRAARAIGGWIGARYSNEDRAAVRVVVDLDQIPALAVEREALWARLDAATFLTPDERRRMAGLGEVHPDEAGPNVLGEVADG